jgi:hypothetical protein
MLSRHPLKRQRSQAGTEATRPTRPIKAALCPIRPHAFWNSSVSVMD